MVEKPWLILTLRRTGGTSLTSFLTEISSFSTIEHEPFNVDRMLGHVTRNFKENGDISHVITEITEALAKRPNIKHCVEIIPLEITRELIIRAQDLGYHIMVLTRRNEARRLASLFLASATGAWGSEQAADIYPRIIAGEQKIDAVDLNVVRDRVRIDYYSLGRTLGLLRNRRIDFEWLLFEELYFGACPIEEQAIEIASEIGISVSPDDENLIGFSKQQGQKSESISSYVPNYTEMLEVLNDLCFE